MHIKFPRKNRIMKMLVSVRSSQLIQPPNPTCWSIKQQERIPMTSIIFQLQERTILVSVPLAFRLKVARVRYERVGNRVIYCDPSCNFRVEVSLTQHRLAKDTRDHASGGNNEAGRKVEDGTRARTTAVAPTNELDALYQPPLNYRRSHLHFTKCENYTDSLFGLFVYLGRY